MSNHSIEMSISYHLFAIGDCNTSVSSIDITEKVDQSATAYLLVNLEPWRRYIVTLTAISEFNITDPVTLSVSTGETGKDCICDVTMSSFYLGRLREIKESMKCSS